MPPETDPFVDHSLRTSMFFPDTRLFVAGNPKAAGTTLRWWLLAAHGVDLATRTSHSWWGESAPYQTVWDATIDLTFAWGDLSNEQQADALSSQDVLTVQPVRHPISRLFSAWSGKYLIGEPYYEDRLPAGFPVIPDRLSDEEQIGELFEAFVVALADSVNTSGFASLDVHFWPQSRLLARPPEGNVLVLRQETVTEGFSAIAEHLHRYGLDVDEPPRINETVVPYRKEFVGPKTEELARSIYADRSRAAVVRA